MRHVFATETLHTLKTELLCHRNYAEETLYMILNKDALCMHCVIITKESNKN